MPRSHLAVFSVFVGLGVTTTSVAVGIYVFGYLTPWPVWHPIKILGNVSGLALLAAIAVLIYRRIADAERAGKSTYSDRLFLGLLLLTTLTGYLSELFRLAELPAAAYPVYFIHLVFVFVLIVYLPYSKFAHVMYRTVAMLHAMGAAPASRDAPGRSDVATAWLGPPGEPPQSDFSLVWSPPTPIRPLRSARRNGLRTQCRKTHRGAAHIAVRGGPGHNPSMITILAVAR